MNWNDTVVCGGVLLPRRVCLAPTAALWSCCGLGGYHYIAPAALWLVFLSLTACAQYQYNLFHDLDSTADELHDIQTQALGVVVARRKRVIFGKTYRDPRRLLMLGAMWSELFGFSYTPGQLVIYQLTQSNIAGLLSGPVQFGLCAVFSSLLYLLEGPRWLRKCHLRRPKLGGPILYDMLFMTFAYTLVNVVGCTNGLDSVALGDNVTCASPERYWMVSSLGLVVFGCFFWGTLKYKKQLASDVYAVSFRFQASFDAMMTCTRTKLYWVVCALTVITVEKALLVLDLWLVAVLFGLLNLVHFGALLRYNYKCQPCLGVGLVPNNLRALSFATSCYTTLVSLVISMLQISRHHAEAGTAEWTVFFVAIGLYPAVAATVWRWNRRRAVLFQVPNLSLLDALQHESDRVRAIAAVTVTLETAERDTKSLQSILLALHACLTRPRAIETTFAVAYACRATWFLWYTNFDLRDPVAENETEPFVPFGCWVQPPSRRASLATKTAVPFRQRLSLSGRIMPWRLGTKLDSFAQQPASLAHAFLVAPTPLDTAIKPRGVLRGGPTDQSALLQLVEKATDLAHAVCMTTRIMDNTAIRFCFQHAVHTLAELCRSSCRRSRLLASKVLQEMYQAGVVQISHTTFFYVAANLTVSSSYTKAASAARTLVQFVNDHDDVWVARHMADAITLRLVVGAMHLHRCDGGFVASLLTVLLQGLTTLTTLGGRGPNAATYLDRSLVAALLELQCHPLSALAAARLDDVLATLHEIWENRPNRLRRIVQQLSKTRILVRSIARPSDAAYTLVTTAQLKLIHERQRTRSELVATIHSVLAEGLALSARQSNLSDTVQATVAMLSPLLSTRSDLLSYIHSQLTTAEYWYLCDLIGRPRPRNATAATRSREDR